ncbi:MAG: hypothetical protein AAF447_13555 [Myxococcota bacterium]
MLRLLPFLLSLAFLTGCGSRGLLLDPNRGSAGATDAGLDGALGDGALPDGAVVDGALPDGALPDGTLPDGALPDGGVIRPDGGAGCPGVLLECGDRCVDADVDVDNCGGCGRACAPGEFCTAGSCTATCPLTVCGAECVDLTSSPLNCGGCGLACGETGFCAGGACTDTCPAPLLRCGAACVDAAVDPANCGACGNACTGDLVCGAGSCVLDCPSGLEACAGACLDLEISDDNCGGCGVICPGDAVCRTGRCIPIRDLTDTDGDTVVDLDEGATTMLDTDGDGVPDFEDTDSDGDGISDADEAGDADPATPPVDSDRDGTPDLRDLDSDADGLTDQAEAFTGCLDPTLSDTDGDGQSDLAESVGGTDPCDARSRIADFFFVLPTDDPSGEKARALTFDTNIRKADVVFNMDTTGSMRQEIDNIQASLRTTVIPGIDALIDDAAFGVTEFEDYPLASFGNALCNGGSDPDTPFKLLQQVTTDDRRVQDAVDLWDDPRGCGADFPESGFEALYQIASGDGVTFMGGSVPSFVADPLTPGGGSIGGVGFREDAFPIVIHITDNVSHTRADYVAEGITEAHARSDAIDAFDDVSARFMGIATNPGIARAELVALATETGAVIPPNAMDLCETGVAGATLAPETADDGTLFCPLVFNARTDGSGLSGTLVDAIGELVTSIQLDSVSIRVVGDPNGFVQATIPRAATPPAGAPAPTVADRDGDSVFDSFIDITPGTVVSFTVLAFNDAVPQGPEDQVFTVTLQVVGDDVTVLDETTVVIVVPRLEPAS